MLLISQSVYLWVWVNNANNTSGHICIVFWLTNETLNFNIKG